MKKILCLLLSILLCTSVYADYTVSIQIRQACVGLLLDIQRDTTPTDLILFADIEDFLRLFSESDIIFSQQTDTGALVLEQEWDTEDILEFTLLFTQGFILIFSVYDGQLDPQIALDNLENILLRMYRMIDVP